MTKLKIAAQGAEHGLGRDPRTDHLRPVIEYLLLQGNRPASWRGDAFSFDQGGEGHYTFTASIDAAQLHEHFVFPDSIQVYDDGLIRDSLNRVDICHERPTPPLSFKLAPEHTPLATDTPLSTDPPALDDGKADELLGQLIAARHK